MAQELKNILRHEIIARSTIGAYFQIISALIIWIAFTREQSYSWFWYSTLIAISILSLFRILLKINIRHKSQDQQSEYFIYFVIPLLVSAFIWGFFASYTSFTNGINSNESIVLTLVIMAFMSGALNSLAPINRVSRWYTLLIGTPMLITIFYYSMNSYDIVKGLCFLFLSIYLLLSGRSISKNYVTSVELELDIRRQKNKLQNVVNSVPGFIAVCNSDLDWVESSRSFTPLKENTDLKIIQKNFIDLSHLADTKEIDLLFENKMQTFMISMARIEQPEPGAIFVGAPITELKKIRQQLDVQRASSEFSSRMATLGEMASGVAHEINNPLAIIAGNASQLKKMIPTEIKDSEVITHKIENIIKTSFRISKIIHALKTFARQGQGDPFEPVQLSHVIQDSLELCQQRFKNHGVKLVVDQIPEVIFQGRAVQICQIIVNLLSNAFDALLEQETKIIEIHFQVENDFILIAIQDNGKGIPQHIQDKIFEPFFTTKEVGKGTGLGLSICRGILEDHKGEIKLDSRPGQTRFEIKLPLQQKDLSVA